MNVEIESPIRGIIVEVNVERGDKVEKNDYLFVVELGKSLMTVRSTMPGKVLDVRVCPGDEVAANFVAVIVGDCAQI